MKEIQKNDDGQTQALSLSTPQDMLSYALANGASIEQMSQLMELQERVEAKKAKKAFDSALAKARADMKPVAKNRKGHNGKYADMAAYAEAIDPILSENGLSYRFRTKVTDGGQMVVICKITHEESHFEENELPCPPEKSGSKNTHQQIGSAITYMSRYALIAALGLTSREYDDDANSVGTITIEQADKLKSRLARIGADVKPFLKTFGVSSIDELPAGTFTAASNMVTVKERKTNASE